jgi:putative chitinase
MANYVYANQGGNGNEASGDGWRFLRRLIQITLRNNTCRGKALGLDLIANPDLLLETSTQPQRGLVLEG